MKKYLLGFVAIVVAIGLSAFTKPDKFINIKKILYPSGIGYAQADVEDMSNWMFINLPTCPPSDVKACTIELDADAGMSIYYHTAGGSLILNTQAYVEGTPDLNDRAGIIVAEQGSGASGIYRVRAAGTTATTVTNRD